MWFKDWASQLLIFPASSSSSPRLHMCESGVSLQSVVWRAPLSCHWLELHLWSFNLTKGTRRKRSYFLFWNISTIVCCPLPPFPLSLTQFLNLLNDKMILFDCGEITTTKPQLPINNNLPIIGKTPWTDFSTSGRPLFQGSGNVFNNVMHIGRTHTMYDVSTKDPHWSGLTKH